MEARNSEPCCFLKHHDYMIFGRLTLMLLYVRYPKRPQRYIHIIYIYIYIYIYNIYIYIYLYIYIIYVRKYTYVYTYIDFQIRKSNIFGT